MTPSAPRPAARALAALLLSLAAGAVVAPGCNIEEERPKLPALSSNVQTDLPFCYQPPGCQIVPGSKCMAKVDNTDAPHKTLRLSQLQVLAPTKLATGLVQNQIVTPAVTQYDAPCLLKDATKGGLFNFIVDFDTAANQFRAGGARAVEKVDEGYCFLRATYGNITVEPIVVDLDYDKATGAFATKGLIPKLTVPIFQSRDPSSLPILLPLRNAEIYDGTLSPDGNCIGRYRGETGELDSDCATTTSDVNDPAAYRFENGGSLRGVITIEEADEVVITDLSGTLCTLLTGKKADPKVGDIDRCPRENGQFTADVLKVADIESTPGGPKDAVQLRANFAASAVKIREGECQ